jgi:hypothetical protein
VAGCAAVPDENSGTTPPLAPGAPSAGPEPQSGAPPSAGSAPTGEVARGSGVLRPADILLNRAMAAAGGETALSHARVLIWTGEASVFAGDRRIDLNVETVVEPFTYALSDTWLRDKGRASLRTLEIDGNQGWLTRDGKTEAMPPAMLAHERQQYATYGLMRLVTMRDSGAVFSTSAGQSAARILEVHHPFAADSRLYFAPGGRLIALENTVVAPDGGKPIAQRFEFSGEIASAGVRWPRRLVLTQEGKPYFTLALKTFAARTTR